MYRLALRLLGGVGAEHNRVALVFRSDKIRALLAYLAIEHDKPIRRAWLATLFWGEHTDAEALANLRVSLLRLREALAPSGVDAALAIDRQTVQFNLAGRDDVAVDALVFDAAWRECGAHAHPDLARCAECAPRLERMVEAYGGEFLAGLSLPDSAGFEEWRALQESVRREQALTALAALTARALDRGEHARAIETARRLIALEPWREDGHRLLMRALERSGQPQAALKQYEAAERALRDELGAEPSEELRAAARDIRTGTVGRSPARAPRGNLPRQLTPFFGREDEIAQARAALLDEGDALITLVGPGGIGKTRLSLAVAERLHDVFEDGVWFVPLAGVDGGDGSAETLRAAVATAIAAAVGIKPDRQSDVIEQVERFLAVKRALLVLDNYEHVLAAADVPLRIVERAPKLSVLVTSREALNLQAERVIRVGGLPVPAVNDPGAAEFSSVRMFGERVRRAGDPVPGGIESLARVIEVCRLADGAPLAIELAAAWAGTLGLEPLIAAIRRNFDALAARRADVPERHRSMRAVFEWTWSRLSPSHQAMFAALSVFRGGFDRTAAEDVAGTGAPVLAQFTARSLIRRLADERWDMHELVRQFGAEKLAASGLGAHAAAAHLSHFVALAEHAEPELTGPRQVEWFARLDSNRDNLLAALAYGQSATDEAAQVKGARLAGALWRWWFTRGRLSEGYAYLTRAVAQEAVRAAAPAVHAKTLLGLGTLATNVNDHAGARAWLEQAADLYEQLGDEIGALRARINVGTLMYAQKDYARAETLTRALLERARSLGVWRSVAICLNNLAVAPQERGDFADAARLYSESLEQYRRIGDVWGTAIGLINLADTVKGMGDHARAGALLRESLPLLRDAGDQVGMVLCVEELASLETVPARAAAQLLGAAGAVRDAVGFPIREGRREEHRRAVDAVRARLGDADYEAAWAEGRTMSLEQALTLAGALA